MMERWFVLLRETYAKVAYGSQLLRNDCPRRDETRECLRKARRPARKPPWEPVLNFEFKTKFPIGLSSPSPIIPTHRWEPALNSLSSQGAPLPCSLNVLMAYGKGYPAHRSGKTSVKYFCHKQLRGASLSLPQANSGCVYLDCIF
jgi:hypothetical protein